MVAARPQSQSSGATERRELHDVQTTYDPRAVAPAFRAVVYKLLDTLPLGRYGRVDKGNLLKAVLTLLRDDVTYFKTLTIQDGFGHTFTAAELARKAVMGDYTMRTVLALLLAWGWLREDREHGRRDHTTGRPARMLAWDLARLQALADSDWARSYRPVGAERQPSYRPVGAERQGEFPLPALGVSAPPNGVSAPTGRIRVPRRRKEIKEKAHARTGEESEIASVDHESGLQAHHANDEQLLVETKVPTPPSPLADDTMSVDESNVSEGAAGADGAEHFLATRCFRGDTAKVRGYELEDEFGRWRAARGLQPASNPTLREQLVAAGLRRDGHWWHGVALREVAGE